MCQPDNGRLAVLVEVRLVTEDTDRHVTDDSIGLWAYSAITVR